jgi:hypothetical protein
VGVQFLKIEKNGIWSITMKTNKLFFLVTVLVVVSLACNGSFDVDIGGNDEASQPQNDQNTGSNQNEAVENSNENGSNDDTEAEPTTPGASGDVSKGGGQFPDADEVIPNPTDENVITSPGGQTYAEVQIKSGPDIFTFTEDVNDGCFEIIGIGSSTVQVSRIGDGKDCKEIGGIGLKYAD